MARFGNVIYIDRDPDDIYKGWGWIEVRTEDAKRFGISLGNPETYTRVCTSGEYDRYAFPGSGNLPSRGKAGAKKFKIIIDGELIEIRAQKSLTIKAICAWTRKWAPSNAQVLTPSNKTISVDGEKTSNQAHFVYFVLNEDSNAIKIGIAKDVTKRLKSLQASSPAELKLMKTIQLARREEAEKKEKSLHQKFKDIRLAGEWFRANEELLVYISGLK